MEQDRLLPSEFYESMVADRKDYETTAEDIAKISLPYVIRADGSSKSTPYDTAPSQSFNGGLIQTLKAKMGMALLPPSTSSFRLKPDAMAMNELFEGNENARAEISKQLSMSTDAINSEIEVQQIRDSMFEMILQLIVVGSVIVEKIEGDGIQLYPLKYFVVDLTARGKPMSMCVKETKRVLPEGFTPKEEKEEYELYTLLTYDKDTDKWIMTQDIDGEPVGEEKTYKDYDSLPFRYFGWTWMVGDKYHRSFSEAYQADMEQMDALSKLNTQGSVISAKSLLMVNQRGNRTRKKDVSDSVNGAVIDGSAEDITAFQFNKNHDFQVSNDRERIISERLSEAFLKFNPRQSERTTATEINYQQKELESSTLAGVYSKLSLGWSKWIVEKVMDELKIKFDSIGVDVLTGLDALGRSTEAQKQDGFVQRLAAVEMTNWLKESELVNRWATYDGINTVGLVKTPDEVAQERQAQQQAAQQATMMEAGAQSVGQSAGQALTGQGQPQQG